MRLRVPATLLTMALLALPASATATTATEHFTAGEQLVNNLERTPWPGQAAINQYDTGGTAGVTWGTLGSPVGWSNDTKCARMVRELYRHAYSWATDTWFTDEFHSIGPDTEQLQQYMPTAHHFDVIEAVGALQPGDLVMFNKSGTGVDHTVVVREVTPLGAGMAQEAGKVGYAVRVIDSTSNPHGDDIDGVDHKFKAWADTRREDVGTDTIEHNGAGSGWMILYANADGTIHGWRWGVNEGALWMVSPAGNKVMFARTTVEE